MLRKKVNEFEDKTLKKTGASPIYGTTRKVWTYTYRIQNREKWHRKKEYLKDAPNLMKKHKPTSLRGPVKKISSKINPPDTYISN